VKRKKKEKRKKEKREKKETTANKTIALLILIEGIFFALKGGGYAAPLYSDAFMLKY
jgi:hypothetical protein